MNKKLYNKYPKADIAQLPVVHFEGRIVVVVSEREAERAVSFLLTQPILGIDTETRPTFRRGEMHQVALLQVSAHDICFLFRLNYLGASAAVRRLLEDTEVPKVGLSLRDDMMQLHRLVDFEEGLFIDFQDRVREIGVEDMSLQKLYANFFGQKISKRQQLTNWEHDVLTDKQKLYAATDAWSCIRLYEELLRLEETGDYVLVENEEIATASVVINLKSQTSNLKSNDI